MTLLLRHRDWRLALSGTKIICILFLPKSPLPSMSPAKKTLRPIKNLLQDSDQTLRQLTQGAVDLKPFQGAWDDILPKEALDYIQPAFYRDGKLTVWVDSPVWANWIRHRNSLIISRIQERRLPEVHTLVVRLSPQSRSRTKSESTTNGSQDRKTDANTDQIVNQTAEGIADPQLRGALQRLVRTLRNLR